MANTQRNRAVKAAKRVDFVSIKLCRESSVLYKPRFISSSKDVFELVQSFLVDCDREKLVVVCLDTKHQPTAISTVSLGTLDSSLAHPREIFKTAILSNSAAIILAHNHPSGVASPSEEDVLVTKRVANAGVLLGIDVLDHLVIGSNNYRSLKESGLM